jgi:hypothetical protein
MSALLKALTEVFRALSGFLTLLKEYRLRKEGENRVRMKTLERSVEQLKEAHEIDSRVHLGELTSADIERMRKYQRQ